MNQQQKSAGQRWQESRPKKTAVFWACVGSAVATMLLGFTWGGWVTGSTARSMAEASAESAVVRRLAPMCLVRFEQDPRKVEKLEEVKTTDTWQRSEFIRKQGWATMPGEQDADAKVADECAKLLMLKSK